jgi:hypothetical protein
MINHTRRSPLRALFSGLAGIIIFLLVLVLCRFIAGHTSFALFSGFVDLLVANVVLLIFISVLFMFGDIFAAFPFPFSLPFPVFNAVGGVFLISFLFRVLGFLDTFYSLGLFPGLEPIRMILYPLTFIVVIIAGYISIAAESWKRKPDHATPSPGPGRAGGSTSGPTWEEIGNEFRQMISDLIRRIRDDINRK